MGQSTNDSNREDNGSNASEAGERVRDKLLYHLLSVVKQMVEDVARGAPMLAIVALASGFFVAFSTLQAGRMFSAYQLQLNQFNKILFEAAQGHAVANSSLPAPPVTDNFSHVTTAVIVAILGLVLTITRWAMEGREIKTQQDRLEAATKEANDNPEKPQLAWEAGRATLEKYLNRNLAQVRTIATLTYIVMFGGFGMIMYGLFEAFTDPAKLKVSIVSSASGVLVSFIGGSFLLVYRSLLAQSRDYLIVLERINGVGMAVAVIESIPDENAKLKHETTAELAKNLLTLYGASREKGRRAHGT
jgi:hypothetical protein